MKVFGWSALVSTTLFVGLLAIARNANAIVGITDSEGKSIVGGVPDPICEDWMLGSLRCGSSAYCPDLGEEMNCSGSPSFITQVENPTYVNYAPCAIDPNDVCQLFATCYVCGPNPTTTCGQVWTVVSLKKCTTTP